jgi:hypothetical protein
MLHVLRRLDARVEGCLGASDWDHMFSRDRRRGTKRTVQRHFFLGDGGNVGEAFFDRAGRINVMLNFDWYRCMHYPESEYVFDDLYEEVCKQDFLCREPAVLMLRECAIEASRLDMTRATCKLRFFPSRQNDPSTMMLEQPAREHSGQLAEGSDKPSSQASSELTQALTSTFTDIWDRSSNAVSMLNKECSDLKTAKRAWPELVIQNVRDKVRVLISTYNDRLLRTGFVATDNKDLLYEREQFVIAGLRYMYDKLFDVMACLFPSGSPDTSMRRFLLVVGGRRFQTIPEVVCFVQWGQCGDAVDAVVLQ